MTVYDVCRSDDNLLYINAQPYSLQSVLGPTPYMGHTFFRHPSSPSESEISMFMLSERGSVHFLDLEMPMSGEETPPKDVGNIVEWSEDVKELNVRANDLRSDFGYLGARDGGEVNLHSIYDSE